jgi:hypothetical protein
VRDANLTREVACEDEAAAQDGDDDEVTPLVVAGDLGAELGDPRGERLPGEVDLPETVGTGRGYRCSVRWN